MIKKLNLTLLLAVFLGLFSTKLSAQLEKGVLVDGIAAVIGDEIILESDLEEQINYAKQQGMNVSDKCQAMETIVNNKLLVVAGKKDTLIENRSEAIKESASMRYNQILSQFPDEKTMLQMYKFRTAYEMKSYIEKSDTDQYYGQAKYGRITEKADVTPNEVTDFYNTHKLQFPEVKDEVTIAQISIYPKLTDAHKDEIIAKLNKIKQDILAGESFESQARIYSEDPGSASNGGLYTNISRGKMVKQFEAAALNLQEGEISEPVESEFGFHLIQLVKKSGKLYDARHILIMAKPTDEEIAATKTQLENIKTQIESGKMTFKEAAFKYSDDKKTKFNGGVLNNPEDGSTKIEKESLSANVAYQLAGINKGDLSEVFEDELNQKKIVTLIKVEDSIPAHQLTIETDYNRIKQMALRKKQNDMVEKWVKQEIPNTFVSINNRYDNCGFKAKWTK